MPIPRPSRGGVHGHEHRTCHDEQCAEEYADHLMPRLVFLENHDATEGGDEHSQLGEGRGDGLTDVRVGRRDEDEAVAYGLA